MKYKIPHGIAATLFVACAIWLIQSTSTPALALDLLIEKLMQAKTARYDTIATIEDQPPLKMKGYYLEPVHMREEYDGFINISDWAARKKIGLDPKTKRATVFNLKNLPNEVKNGMQEGNWFEGTRSLAPATLTSGSERNPVGFGKVILRSAFAALAGEMLGESTIGRNTAVYLDGTTLWIRSNSRLHPTIFQPQHRIQK